MLTGYHSIIRKSKLSRDADRSHGMEQAVGDGGEQWPFYNIVKSFTEPFSLVKHSNRWTIVLACTYIMIGSNRSLQQRWLSMNHRELYKVQHCFVAGLYWWVLVVTVGEQALEVSTRPTLVWCLYWLRASLEVIGGYTEQLSSNRQYVANVVRYQGETNPVGQCRRY